jgi:hypothetical protein
LGGIEGGAPAAPYAYSGLHVNKHCFLKKDHPEREREKTNDDVSSGYGNATRRGKTKRASLTRERENKQEQKGAHLFPSFHGHHP